MALRILYKAPAINLNWKSISVSSAFSISAAEGRLGRFQEWDFRSLKTCFCCAVSSRISVRGLAPEYMGAKVSPPTSTVIMASERVMNPVRPMSWNHAAVLDFQEVHSVTVSRRVMPFSTTYRGDKTLVLSVSDVVTQMMRMCCGRA